jgi:hypothetical protein
LLIIVANRLSWRIHTVIFRLLPFKVNHSVASVRYKIREELIHVLKLLSSLKNNVLHHLKLLIYCLRNEIKGSVRMINRNLLIIWLLVVGGITICIYICIAASLSVIILLKLIISSTTMICTRWLFYFLVLILSLNIFLISSYIIVLLFILFM